MADNNGEIIYYCSECGREYPSDIMYCEHDGAQITIKKRAKITGNVPKSSSNGNNERYYLVDVITGERFAIPSGITAVGREVSNALIPLSDSYDEVSRSHANIILGKGNELRIQNTSTSNGTHVNGQTIGDSELRLLKEGDVIVLGGDIYKKHILCLRLEKGE